MKVLPPPATTPLPDRKPVGSSTDAGASNFRAMLDPEAEASAESKAATALGGAGGQAGLQAAMLAQEAGPVPSHKPTTLARGRFGAASYQQAAYTPDSAPRPIALPMVSTTSTLPTTSPLSTTPADQPAAALPASSSAARQIIVASHEAARLSGHSAEGIIAQATQESGLNPAAKNRRSSASGPFQFLERTWLAMVRQHGAQHGLGHLSQAISMKDGVPVVNNPVLRKQILDLRHHIGTAASMAGHLLADGRALLSHKLGRPVSEAESRVAYVLGAGGAASLIRAAEKSPQTAASEILPKAAAANHSLFFDRGGRALTAGEAMDSLMRRMDKSEHKKMFAAMTPVEEPGNLNAGGNAAALATGSGRDLASADDDGPTNG